MWIVTFSDVYEEDTTTKLFEKEIATKLGHEAGLFVSSGTMGNQLALRSLLIRPPHSILSDYRAHVAVSEAGGISSLSQAMLQPVVPENGVYLTLEDVKKSINLSEDIHDAPTRVISLENTLGGSIMPLSEVQRITTFARQHGVKLHLDGARLWDAGEQRFSEVILDLSNLMYMASCRWRGIAGRVWKMF